MAPKKVALVLAGGAARGAYEVGVIDHILTEVSKDLGRDVPLDVLSGTSVGAINVCALAAFADEPRTRATRMVKHWTELRIADVVRPDVGELISMMRGLFARGSSSRRGGIFDPAGLAGILDGFIPFERIDANVRAGKISAVTVSTTHVASGRTVVFVQRAADQPPLWRDATVIARPTKIRAGHALASAAIPFLFPSVTIAGESYYDGGLRQNVPLSPARQLGAEGIVIVNPRYMMPPETAMALPQGSVTPTPLFLLGKTINALLLDRIDNDLDRVRRINDLLEAGTRRYGEGFVAAINEELGRPPEKWMRPVKTMMIRVSHDIGKMAGEFVRSSRFAGRSRGMVGTLLKRLADGESPSGTDFLSYLLFDGEFAGQLIEVGRADARARHGELVDFFEEMLDGQPTGAAATT